MAEALVNEYLEAGRQRGDTIMESRALNMLGNVASNRRKIPQAEKFYRSALALAKASGNLSLEAFALGNLGETACTSGDYAAARDYALIALERTRDLGDMWNIIVSVNNLSMAYLKLGEMSAVRQLMMREALPIIRSTDAPPLKVWAVSFSARIRVAEKELDRALALFGLIRKHPRLLPANKIDIEEGLAQIDLPPEQIESGLAAGASLDFAEVVQEILDGKW
jgi:tetratricopeptide (TPR) repeat protein